jgi:hypothetical protein
MQLSRSWHLSAAAAALVWIGMVGPVGAEETDMFSDCKMAQAVVAQADGEGYRLDVLASPVLCVDPTIAQDLWAYAGVLQVTNTGAAPMELTHHTGESGGLSFRGDRVAEAHDPADGEDYDQGPIDFSAGGLVTQTIAPGAAATVIGDPRYILTAIDLAQSGRTASGLAVATEARFDRSFRVTFLAQLTIVSGGSPRDIKHSLPAILRIQLKDSDNE